jgi:hypothetical protein
MIGEQKFISFVSGILARWALPGLPSPATAATAYGLRSHIGDHLNAIIAESVLRYCEPAYRQAGVAKHEAKRPAFWLISSHGYRRLQTSERSIKNADRIQISAPIKARPREEHKIKGEYSPVLLMRSTTFFD